MSKTIMKNVFHLSAVVALALLCSCGKNQTEAERNAEVERKVQERLAAEKQTQEQQRLTQAQMDLDQRLKDLETSRQNAAATPAPARETHSEPQRDRAPRSSAPQRGRDELSGAPTASYSTFYTRLEPQGAWRETSNYGYVWQPRVAQESRDWRPYTQGRWVYTDAGWTWISQEPFGWATYHYGRWTRLRNIGWVWVPGDEWAPAWVSWRKSNDYVGWAPLPPEARFERSSGIHNWADNYYDIGPDQYSFVPTNQLGDQRVERAVLPIERNVTIINETTNVTNITYNNTTIVNQGPNYDEMRSRSQQPIERFRLERQVNINFDSSDPRPVVRGEVIQVPGPIIARAQPVERPRGLQEAVMQVVVDHGWERVGDRQAAEKVRVKMRTEATPPPNAPSRTFVKPVEAALAPATATAAPSPAAALATATPERMATPLPDRSVRPEASPSATLSVAPSATPSVVATPKSTPVATATIPRPTHTITPLGTPQRVIPPPRATIPPEASSAPSAALVSPATTPLSTLGRGADAKEQRKAERQLRKQEGAAGRREEPLPQSTPAPQSSPVRSATPVSSPTAATAESPFLSRREQRKQERVVGRPDENNMRSSAPSAPAERTPSVASTPLGTATPAPAAAAAESNAPALSRREQRKEERRAKRTGQGEGDETPSPSPTASGQ